LSAAEVLNNQGTIPSSGRVSVIIPAYNVSSYIVEALDSVFAQTLAAHQVIVVNDGSPDTAELERAILPYRDRITYLVQENRGLSGARNTGLRAATGDLVALLDADDVMLPTYLEEQASYLGQHPEKDLVYCDALFFGASVHDGIRYMELCPSEGEASSDALISRRCHVFVAVMARTPVLAGLGFDESLRSCEDFDCWLRLTAAGHTIGYQRKVLIRYRKHAASLSADPGRMAEYNLKVLHQSLPLWPKSSEEVKLLNEAIAIKQSELDTIRGKLALTRQDIPTAIRFLKAANAYRRSAKVAVIIVLLRVMPGVVRLGYSVRDRLSPAHREN
jgi:glycosyltransferase involved in cell wall biosynthesis